MGFIALGLIIRIVFAFTVDAEIISDQLKCLNAAKQTAQGDFSWTTSDLYFEQWAYQIPFVLYEGIVLKLFGTLRALYVFNGIFSVASCFLVYFITKKIYDTSVALITTAVISCFPLFILSIGRLYNQTIAGVFLLLAIYFFVSVQKRELFSETPKSYLKTLSLCALSGTFLGISNLLRAEAVIGIIALVCWFIYNFVVNFKKEKIGLLIIRSLLCIITVYALYKTVNVGVDLAVKYSSISPNGIKNGCPYWLVVCGLTPESFGLYNTKYSYIIKCKDPAQQFEIFKSILKEITQGKSFRDFLSFFAKKEFIMWGQISPCANSNLNANTHKIVLTILNTVNHCAYILTIALAAIGIKKKSFNPVISLFYILFLGFFLVFIIKEISPVYRYSTILISLLAASSGINLLLKSKDE